VFSAGILVVYVDFGATEKSCEPSLSILRPDWGHSVVFDSASSSATTRRRVGQLRQRAKLGYDACEGPPSASPRLFSGDRGDHKRALRRLHKRG
jgi:hypothetical protein